MIWDDAMDGRASVGRGLALHLAVGSFIDTFSKPMVASPLRAG